MPEGTARKVCFSSFGFYVIGMLLYIVGFACPYWIYEENGGEFRSGLWKTCTKGPLDDDWHCDGHEITESPGWFQAVIAFMIMGLILAVGAGVKVYPPVGAALEIAAGVFGLIAICIYAPKMEEDVGDVTLGWAYWVTVSAVAVFIINGASMASMAVKMGMCNMERQMPV